MQNSIFTILFRGFECTFTREYLIIMKPKMCLYFQPEERVEAEAEMKMRRMVQEENHLDRALSLTF